MIYPIENFFSAFAIVCLNIFSAFSVSVVACINVMPYGLGVAGGLGWDIRGEGAFGGVAVWSVGDEGSPGQFVRECDAADEVADPVSSDIDDRLELLLRDRVNVEELKNDLAGDVVTEDDSAGLEI